MKIRIAMVAAGVALMAVGALAVLASVKGAALTNLGIWLVAGVALHDVVIALAVASIGFVVAKTIPRRVRGIVQGGLIVAAAVALMSIPVVLGKAKTPLNPSILPLDYPRNLMIIIGIVFAITAVVAAVKLARRQPELVDEGPKVPLAD